MKGRAKSLSIVVWVLLLVALTASPSRSAPPDWPKTMSFPAGRVGTSVYAVTIGMSDLISKYTGVKTVPEAGATSRNLVLLHRKQAELGLTFNDSAYFAVRGEGEFKEYGKMKIRLLFSNSVPTPFAFITRRDANIRTVADLKGKNVMCIYPPSSTFTIGANMLFDAVGMSPASVRAMSFSGNQEGSTALKERRIAAYIHVQTVPSVIPFVQELNTEIGVRLVGVPEEKLDAIMPRYPYFTKGVLPAKIYKELIDIMACREDLPDDLVYEVMKAIFDHVEELLPIHPVARIWTANPVAYAVLPFHTGAVKYYKERKLWTDQLEKKQKQLLADIAASK
jgi:TRAP transporter TAXI family solute receptor